jgi:predicted transcriptional regulator
MRVRTDIGEPEGAYQQVGITLGNLASADMEFIWIHPQATFHEAITIMLLNGYSQLPVMTSTWPRDVKGAVTWQSIAAVRYFNPNATLRDATISEGYSRWWESAGLYMQVRNCERRRRFL